MDHEADRTSTTPRRLPFSRAFAQAGFSPAEAEVWRRAGWDDADEAARWRHLSAWWDPELLRSLADEGVAVAEVDRAMRFGAELDATRLRARIASDRELTDVEIDLRDKVRENLQLGLSPLSHRS